jgi:uncharacterized membrane protein YdjX (TVP38/TMEM64 family)
MRIALLILAILLALAIPAWLVGDQFESMLSGEGVVSYLRGLGPWAGVAATSLMMMDLFIPIPAPAIMAALGLVYGAVVGGLIASAGNFAAAMLGYGLCRMIGPRAAAWIAGPAELERLTGFFDRYGMWSIALTRWAPAIPEILACLAGLTRMPLRQFVLGSALGSVAVGFAYAWLGATGEDDPGATLAALATLPYAALAIFMTYLARHRWTKRKSETGENPQ